MTQPRALLAIAAVLSSTMAITTGGLSSAIIVRAGGAPLQKSCAAHVATPAVCDQTLGMAVTVPQGWSVVPREKFSPGYLAFWTLIPGSQEPPQDLVIEPVGLASCSDSQAAPAVAEALARTMPGTGIVRRRGTVAGAPAVYHYNVPGGPEPSVQIVVAHHRAVYQLILPGLGRALRPDQQRALDSLRFIPRVGPFPQRLDDPFLATALRQCARLAAEA